MLLGDDEASDLDAALRGLEEAELIERRGHAQPGRAQPGDSADYAFRHALIGEAASELLSEHDRSVGLKYVAELRRDGAPTPAPTSPSSKAPSSAHRS